MKLKLPKLKAKEKTPIEKEVERGFEKLASAIPGTDEYDKIVESIKKVSSLNLDPKKVKEAAKQFHVDPNTIIVVVGSVLELVLIMKFEQADIICTKAFSRLLRPRL